MKRDAGDILDRLSIAKLKFERCDKDKKSEREKELKAFLKGLDELKEKYPKYDWEQFLKLILTINDSIWQLEAGQKGGTLELPNPHYIFDNINNEILAQIGIEGILIKNINAIRIIFKNIVNRLVGEGFQDYKKDHLSERK